MLALRRVGILILLSLGVVAVQGAPQSLDVGVAQPAPVEPLYFSLRPDFRRCVSPLCGGAFIRRVNRSRTLCADGVYREECYVAQVLWQKMGPFAVEGATLVLGVQVDREFPPFGRLGVLVPRAAWRPAGGAGRNILGEAPAGRWYGLSDNGIRCITAPCYNIQQRLLNRTQRRSISNVDLEDVMADEADIAQALRLLAEDELIAVGENLVVYDEGPAVGTTFVASEFFLPVAPKLDSSLYCEDDGDCTVSEFHSPVASPEACYCALCPRQPVNVYAAGENEESWRRHCREFAKSTPICLRRTPVAAGREQPEVFCAAPPPVRCVANQCVLLKESGPVTDE